MRQHQHGGHHGFRLEGIEHFLGHQPFGHARGGRGGQGVDMDVVLGAFQGQGLHQPHLGQLGSAIVALTKVAIQTGGRGGHHDAPVLLGHHVRPHRLAAVRRAHQVHIHHQAEVVHAHLGKALVTQNAGIVDQHIHAAPGVDGLLHHGLHRCKVGHRGCVGQGLAARSTNLVHHLLRRTCGATAAVHGTAQVIDQHPGAAGRQGQRMLTPQAATCARDDGYAAFEFDVCHGKTLRIKKGGE